MVTGCRRLATPVTRRTPWPPAYPRHYGTPDAARIGLDRNTPEGAEIAFFSQLNASKPWHRAVAWVALFVMFGVPVLLRIMDWLHV